MRQKVRARLHVRLSDADARLLQAAAAHLDTSVSELVRATCIPRAVEVLRGSAGRDLTSAVAEPATR